MSGAHLNTFKGHSNSVMSVVFSPNGTQVVSRCLDDTFILWDAISGDIIDIYYTKSTNTSVQVKISAQSAICYYFIVDDDGWTYLRNQKFEHRLCWIPVSCRPSNNNYLAFNGTHVALSSDNGHIIILDLSGMQLLFFTNITHIEC